MERLAFEHALNNLICKILDVKEFDNNTNILGRIAAYDILYIIKFIESHYNVAPEQLLKNMQYTDMSIHGLADRVYDLIGD